jgi:integrase
LISDDELPTDECGLRVICSLLSTALKADYLCADAHRRWMHVDTPSKWFVGFVRRHQLPPLTLHGLRHTAATLMIEAGIPVRTVSEHLGHGQTSTTVNIYTHSSRANGIALEKYWPERCQQRSRRRKKPLGRRMKGNDGVGVQHRCR